MGKPFLSLETSTTTSTTPLINRYIALQGRAQRLVRGVTSTRHVESVENLMLLWEHLHLFLEGGGGVGRRVRSLLPPRQPAAALLHLSLIS